MIYTSEPVNPSLIENTTMVKNFRDGVASTYYITPMPGYVLHDNARDWDDTDPETFEEVFKRGYTRATASCAVSYDFNSTINIDGYTAYGPREFFTRPLNEVPADQIFGGVNSDQEVM